MSDTRVTTTVLRVVSSATNDIASVNSDNTERVRDILDDIAVELSSSRGHISSTDDKVMHRYLSEIESLVRQIRRYGDPELGDYTVPGVLRTAETNLIQYYNNEKSHEELISHIDDVRESVLAHRPETTVIQDHGLEEEFSKVVRQAFRER